MSSSAQRVPDPIDCFLGFQLTERSCAYLQQMLIAPHQMLAAKGWPVRPVQPDKWHATMVNFGVLSLSERETVWPEVEAAAARGAWKDPGFRWRGLTFWPSSGAVVLASESYPALERWGLDCWIDHPICAKGELRSLKRYTPHVTVMRLKTEGASKTARAQWAEEWKDVQSQLDPIDPERIQVDRITFFLSDFSQGPYRHRHIHEHTLNIA